MAESLVGNDAVLWVNTSRPVAAALSIGAGNAGVRYTALEDGPVGNDITIAHVAQAGANAPTDVQVDGNDIVVRLETGGVAGTETATAAEVMAAVNNDPAASLLVVASLLGDGSGTAVEAAAAPLTGGAAAPAANYEMVALQRGLTSELSVEMIDASHKGSKFAKSRPGRQSGTMSLEALEPDPDFGGAVATHEALIYAFDNGNEILCELRKKGSTGASYREAARALIGTMSREYPDNDVSVNTIELTLQENFRKVG